MKRALLVLVLVSAIGFVGMKIAAIVLNEVKNRSNPAQRFVSEGVPPAAGAMSATAYVSMGMMCKNRKWTLTHTPEELKQWIASGDFKRADQRLSAVRQILEPKAPQPFRDKKYCAAYLRTQPGHEGQFLLVQDGEKQSDYVIVDRPFPQNLLQLLAGS